MYNQEREDRIQHSFDILRRGGDFDGRTWQYLGDVLGAMNEKLNELLDDTYETDDE